MHSIYQIIFINGPSSVGKTTLAHAMQEEFDDFFLHIGIDRMIGMMPDKVNNWIGGPAPLGFSWKKSIDLTGYPMHEIQMGPFAKMISQTLKEIVVTMAKAGHFIIIDEVAFGKTDIDEWRQKLKDYCVLWIGIQAELSTIESREKERGDRILGSARAQYFKVHQHVMYDLEFDTSQHSIPFILSTIKHQIYKKN